MCLLSFLKWGSIGYPLRMVQWDFTRRDHPGNSGRLSGSGPVSLVGSSPDQVHILPKPAAHSTHEAPTAEASPSALLVQNFRKLVVTVQTFATTSQTLATAHTAWLRGWFRCWFRFRAPGP